MSPILVPQQKGEYRHCAVYNWGMSLDGGASNNGAEKSKPKKTLRSFSDLPGKGGINKAARRVEREKNGNNNLQKLTQQATIFKNEIDSELDGILKRAGIESGDLSVGLRREGKQFEIEIDIKDTVLPDVFDLKYAADKIKSHIESDPRNPHNVTVLVRISRARDKNREALESGGPTSPHLNAQARREMIQKELERLHELLDKLADQLERNGFTPKKEKREVHFRTTRTKEGQEIYEVAIDNEDAPQSVQNTVQRLALIETRLLTGTRVLVQTSDGKVVIESRELGARVEGATEKAGAAKENLDNLKAEMFPKLRPRLKEFALAVGTAPIDTEEGKMLSRIVSVQMTEALDDILRLEKSSGKKGKEQARTNMIGGTTLFNRLQKLGLIDQTGSQINPGNIAQHIAQYLESGSGAKDNFIIALHNISARFQKTNRERAFPRTRPLLVKKMTELGLHLEDASISNTETQPLAEEPWRLALGIHPDADGEGIPRILRRPLGPNPNPIVTAEFASLLRDMDTVNRIEGVEGETPSPATERITPSLEEFVLAVEDIQASPEKGALVPTQADERIYALETTVAALQAQLADAAQALSSAQAEIETLRTLSQTSEENLVNAEAKVVSLTENIQRAEAQRVILDTFANELRRVSNDPEAVLEMTKIAIEALQEIEK